jgi:HD superfamily phosphohydrolase
MVRDGTNPSLLLDESRFTVAVRDPVWRHIWLTEGLAEIIRSESFLRLYRIKQLGPTEYVYPGATHTRASHSFGVYHVALRILRVLAARGASEWITPVGCMSFLSAALLHDLGHFPFTHSLKELPLDDHETLSSKLILSEPLASLIAQAGGNAKMTAAIVDSGLACVGGNETEFFRNILSGVLDPDKLDYLNRDAYYCGVPYGIQDTDFILSQILPDSVRGIVIPSRAIMSIESILFSKYLMYRSVYWHRQVRLATAMMKKALYAALGRNLIAPEDLYSKDDAGLYDLVLSLNFPEREIALAMREKLFYKILAEYSFNPDDASHIALEKLESRDRAEESIAAYLSSSLSVSVQKKDVLIDIPENISFESKLWVTDAGTTFSNGSTVFSQDVVSRFTASLRIVRIAVNPVFHERTSAIPDIGAKLAKCVAVG